MILKGSIIIVGLIYSFKYPPIPPLAIPYTGTDKKTHSDKAILVFNEPVGGIKPGTIERIFDVNININNVPIKGRYFPGSC